MKASEMDKHIEKPSMLFLTNEFCFPPQTGAHVRIANILQIYSHEYDIYLLVPHFESTDLEALNAFCDNYISELHFINEVNERYNIAHRILSYLVGPKTVLTNLAFVMAFETTIRSLIRIKGPFDTIHIGRWFLTEVVKNDLLEKRFANNYILDFDASDWSIRRQYARSFSGNPILKAKLYLEPWRVRFWEIRYLHKFAAVLVSSITELESLRQRTACSNLLLVKNGYDIADDTNLEKSITAHIIVLFVGGLDYYPNRQGFEWFANNVWPLVQAEFPSAKFWHAGKHSDEIKVRYDSVQGIHLKGFVDKLSDDYKQATIVVAPIFLGSGTRIKLLEAASFGKAIVATEFAAEDLGFTDGVNISYANNHNDMAVRICDLIRHSDERERIGTCARTFIDDNYKWSSIGEDMLKGIDCLLSKHFFTR